MADDIKAMTAELAGDPGSLVFMPLAEALRRRGQFEVAQTVVLGGLERHPDMIEAHDLYARILVDMGEYDVAQEVWTRVLEDAPRHLGAHKGLGFLYYRRGDLYTALDHLELALAEDPRDKRVIQALRTVRNAVDDAEAAAEAVDTDSVFSGLEGGAQSMLLVDERGRVLGGGLQRQDGADVTETVGALLAGAAEEAERTARLLALGDWSWMVAEATAGNVYVTQPTKQTLLLIARDRSVPSGRLSMLAERAAEIARRWLGEQGL